MGRRDGPGIFLHHPAKSSEIDSGLQIASRFEECQAGENGQDGAIVEERKAKIENSLDAFESV